MSEIVVPYRPRKWAREFHATTKRWIALVLHRRAGKTTAELNHHQRAALDDAWESARLRHLMPELPEVQLKDLLKRRVYWHVMPSYRQGKLTGAWDTLKEISDPIPGVRRNEQEMLVTYPNGNKVQIIGADNPDSLRGPGLSGLSLDEYSQIPSQAFSEVLSKALADHLGYAIFSGTIKGQDQLYRTYEAAKEAEEWFALWRNVDDSLKTESGATIAALTRAMDDERKLVVQGLMTQAEFDQEWYLSPEAAIKGAFYAAELTQARKDGRIGTLAYDPALPVGTDWDLGIDAMAVWFTQEERSGNVRVIDYEESVGEGLVSMIKTVREKPYIYGEHWAPHDIEVREISSGTTRKQIAAEHGINFKVTPRIDVGDGITAVQAVLSRCWFDEVKCKDGLEALRHYRRTYSSRLDQFTASPIHDWSSHGADAFRGFAVRRKPPKAERPPRGPGFKGQEFAWA